MIEGEKIFGIKQWAEDDRPREKLLLKGKSALSDAELLAILISTGTKEFTAVDLAQQILHLANNNLNELGKLSVKDLQKIKGIGEAKAITIAATLELGRRRKDAEPLKKEIINSSTKAYAFFEPILADNKQEEFWVLLLNRANKVISAKKISEGGIHATVVDVKIVFHYALENLASSMVLCHNHPSGSIQPSAEDIRLTKQLAEAAKLLEIHVSDHIIIGEKSYYSFADNSKL